MTDSQRLDDWEANSRMSEDEYPEFIKRFYAHHTGKTLNLDNPQTFNEKIQWAKLHDRDPLRTKLADKYAVREWVAERVGEKYLIPLLGFWKNAEDIDFGALPDRFVLKCNHGCAMNIVVKDKAELDVAETREKLNEWLKVKFAYKDLELHYIGIEPRIIAEEYIEDIDSGDLFDYQFFCFNGEPFGCKLGCKSGMDAAELEHNWYDTKWRLLLFDDGNTATAPRNVPKPKKYRRMVKIVRVLSKGIPFVRVDLYNIKGKILFGETTFTPTSGCKRFDPPEYDETLGKLYRLPKNDSKTIS